MKNTNMQTPQKSKEEVIKILRKDKPMVYFDCIRKNIRVNEKRGEQ